MSPPVPPEAAIRAVLFDLDGRRYALRLEAVRGVGQAGPVRAVPRSPAFVRGLCAWHGELLTVLDLPALLGAEPSGDPSGCLILLADPLERTALHVPGVVSLGWIAGDAAAPGAEPLDDLSPSSLKAVERASGATFLDPPELIRRHTAAEGL